MYEWDEAKSRRTLEERGFDFKTAAKIFRRPVLEWCDTRLPWGETRIVAVGVVDINYLTVVYTPRDGLRRIISARPSRRNEIRAYEDVYGPGPGLGPGGLRQGRLLH